MKKRIEAFTLIEILVALTIIGILLTFVAPYVFDRPDQARKLKVQNDLMAITTALHLHKLDHGRLPEITAGLDGLTANSPSGQVYLKNIPLDPWGTPYRLLSDTSLALVVVSAGPDQTFDETLGGDDIVSEPVK